MHEPPGRSRWQTLPAETISPAWTVGVVATLALYVAATPTAEGPAQLGLTVMLVAVLGLIAQRAGLTLADLGARPDRLGSGLRWGATAAVAIATVTAALALLPATRSFFMDARVADAPGSEVAFDALVRIPIGTALLEEAIFRGVLLGLLLRQRTALAAVVVSSALFGLWHVVSASGFADANSGIPDTAAGTLLVVPAIVIVTGTAGAFLAWLRIRSGSLAAPVIAHATVNSCALIAAWLVSS